MSALTAKQAGAGFARPLGFTLLSLYGLLSFLTGYRDWQSAKLLAPWIDWLQIACGLLLGSAAIRLMLRRHRAWNRTLFALTALWIGDLVAPMLPGSPAGLTELFARTLLSAVILFCVRRADRALLPADSASAAQR